MEQQTGDLQRLLLNAPMVMLEWSPLCDPEVKFATANLKRLLGYEVGPFLTGRQQLTSRIHDADRSRFLLELESLREQPEHLPNQIEHALFRMSCASGEWLWLRATSLVARSSEVSQQKLLYHTYILDGSPEHALEESRGQSEERFEQIFETNLAVKLLIDPSSGSIVKANEAAAKFYGYSVATLTSMSISQINILSVDEIAVEMQRAKNEERLFFRFRHRLASGEIRDVEVFSGPIHSTEGSLLYSIVFDVTDRNHAIQSLEISNRRLQDVLSELRTTQSQMVQRERLAAIGQLTTGIAHDFNNIMTGIICTAELMHLMGDLSQSHEDDLLRIRTSGDRATKLIQQLLDFSRQSSLEKSTIEFDATCHQIVDFLQRIVPAHIEIDFQAEENCSYIEASATGIEQVVTNLVLNARDAIEGAGRISVFLKRVAFEPGTQQCRICESTLDGDWIRLDVRDDGCGIAEEELPRIFEPFYTTKAPGLGSGLGLAQTSGIVHQHGGHVVVCSKPGVGTTISCFFPVTSTTELAPEVESPNDFVRGNRELILLVEDDPMVRRICEQMLEFLNYRVVSAENGKEAINLFLSNQNSIAAVVSDTVMPEMGGLELHKELRQLNPDLGILLMSGYPLGEQNNRDLNQVGWLKKPIDMSTLSRELRQALECGTRPLKLE